MTHSLNNRLAQLLGWLQLVAVLVWMTRVVGIAPDAPGTVLLLAWISAPFVLLLFALHGKAFLTQNRGGPALLVGALLFGLLSLVLHLTVYSWISTGQNIAGLAYVIIPFLQLPGLLLLVMLTDRQSLSRETSTK